MSIPRSIARYRLLGELGRGGMGVVHRAEDPQLARQVAVKVILFPPQADDAVREQLERRFEREARAAASLQHPGIVTVHDFGRDGDYLYLVMELVEGRSLAERLRQGPRLGHVEAFELAARVAESLAAAHAGGVVHRDVTPRNILLANDGRVVVTDFGLARSLGEETVELTHSGMLVGSPRFMAPELVRNQPFDGRADIFSLGVILHLVLTGRPPFQAPDITALLYQIVHQDPLDDVELHRSLGAETVDLLGRCLAKEPDERFDGAAELARELRRRAAAAREVSLQETVSIGGPAERVAGPKAVRPTSDPGGAAASPRAGRLLTVALLAFMVAASAFVWWLGGWPVEDPTPPARGSLARPASATVPDGERAGQPVGEVSRARQQTAVEEGDATTEPRAPAAPGAVVDPAIEPSIEPAAASDGVAPPPVRAPRGRAANEESTAGEPATDDVAQGAPNGTPDAADDVADDVAPVLALDPLPGDLSDGQLVLSGRVMDDRGVPMLILDGQPVALAVGGGFRVERPLVAGRNVFSLVATDDAGNQTLRAVEVTLPQAATAVGTDDTLPFVEPRRGAERPARIPPRYADRGDGTLLDIRTGLLWTKGPQGEAAPWKAGRGICRRLELARARDWALPTIEELEELWLAGSRQAAEGGPRALQLPDLVVWSTTKSEAAKAWAFDFGSGRRIERATGSEHPPTRVFCVRRLGRQPPRLEGGRPILDGPAGENAPPRPAGGRPPGGRGGGGPGGGPGGGAGGGGP